MIGQLPLSPFMLPSDWHIYAAKLPHLAITYSSAATIVPTVVGALGMDPDHREVLRSQGCVFDDEGDSISLTNPYFCELTSVYWLLHNQHHAYVGNAHYRRKWSEEGIANSDSGVLYVPTELYLHQTVAEQFMSCHPTFNAPAITIGLADEGLMPFTGNEMRAIWNCRHLHCFQMARGPWQQYKDFMDCAFDCLWPIWDRHEHELKALDPQNRRMMGFIGERMITGLILCRDRLFNFPILTSDVELIQ